ncbi:hypothetical protein SAMN05421760_105270 [Neptunomonas antarctica]|uniref:Uncharacterized protein n=1 Tax=Neptunomonas antarctica TaxID=619304 RepID=A0A1N7M8R0_9GAMM|nr:hypothetical protein SAMN05421760_105270 [Neptunomonas antarctica]
MENYIYRYKYLPFDPDGALKIITESTIKFSNPLEFNDPFDCITFIDTQQLTPQRMKSQIFNRALLAIWCAKNRSGKL